MIPFGNYRPDASRFDGGALPYVSGAQPVLGGWGPFPSFVTYSEALPDRACGAYMARRKDGGYVQFAGTRTHLYRLDPATRDWVEIGSGYHLSEGDSWSFVQWGTLLIAANQNDYMQQVDIETSGSATQLNDIKARSLFIIGANLFAGSLLNDPDKAKWSATEDISNWEPASQGSDEQTFPDGGWIQSGFSGENGAYVFQKGAIRFATWQPGNVFNFRFQKISDLGLVSRNAGVKVNQSVFFLAQDGFYEMRGGVANPIGAEQVDSSFYKEVDLDRLEEVRAAADPINKVVYWSYPTTGNTGDLLNRIIGYDWQLKRWFSLDHDHDLLVNAATPGHTLESLDSISDSIETLAASFDSPAWSGGKPVLAAFDDQNQLCFAHGANMPATFRTAEIAHDPAYWTQITRVSLKTDCRDAEVTVGVKPNDYDPVVWKQPVERQRSGTFPVMANGALHVYEATLTGEWTRCEGIQVLEQTRTGMR